MKLMNRIGLFGLLALCAGSGFAAPVGFSVNSDANPGDQLYQIDLATGTETLRGTVQSAQGAILDVEGLALDAEGQLWAVDDQSLSLFPLGSTGLVNIAAVESLTGIGALQGNDFGMTFTCEGDLYLSSVATQTLYLVSLDGTATAVGNLGQNISALAARGNPTRLVGLSNGLLGEGGSQDTRSLYDIDTETGAATLIGPLGAAADDYYEAGLSFDEEGNLWALTDRMTFDNPQGNQVLRLDVDSGTATLVATTSIPGFESLAVAPPSGCEAPAPAPGPTGDEGAWPQIPTLDFYGRLATVLVLLFAGFTALRSRP